ncbi:MAG: hypothetical protein ABR540_18990 [Acidimicrobiales bacterium]
MARELVDPQPATEMAKLWGFRVAAVPAVAAGGGAALALWLYLGWLGLASVFHAWLPTAVIAVSIYCVWRRVEELRGKVYWEPALVPLDTVREGTWVPSSTSPGSLTRVRSIGLLERGCSALYLGDGSRLRAGPDALLTAVVRPGPWQRRSETVPAAAVPGGRPPEDLSDDELRTVVKRSFTRLSRSVEALLDAGELPDRELLIDLSRFLENGMEMVRAYESVSGRLRLRPGSPGDWDRTEDPADRG